MSLSYLGKKSWDTSRLDNIEKVYLAEKKKEEEDKRAQERIKKLKLERENEEFKRMQVNAGLLPASALERQEWIHDWGNRAQDHSTEDYLLGKPINDRDSRKYQFAPLLKESFGNPKHETFVKLHEDPLFQIKKEEMKLRKEITSNPFEMKKIYQEVEKSKEKKEKKSKKDKRGKKEKEREKKRDDSSDSEKRSTDRKKSLVRHRSSSNSIYRSRSRSISKDRYSKKVSRQESSPYNSKRLLSKEENLRSFPFVQKRQMKGLSNEEKAFKLEEMKKNAEDLQTVKLGFQKFLDDADNKEKDRGNFLQNIRKSVYDKETDINDLGDRIKRNIHYLQRGPKEGNSFRK